MNLWDVVQAGVGQAPARKAALYAGLSNSVACTTINNMRFGNESGDAGAQTILTLMLKLYG
jgi:acetyl-CoA C-acetyltransferase